MPFLGLAFLFPITLFAISLFANPFKQICPYAQQFSTQIPTKTHYLFKIHLVDIAPIQYAILVVTLL
jgi:hypothetical protein